ncbi:hypothetical protein LDL59_02335 [Kaistella anthropi]|nr:hypothetical protein [Kaistella anthropi]
MGKCNRKNCFQIYNRRHGRYGRHEKDKALYDPQGRFVVKKTDNLGLETNVTYNDWGQVLSQKDPMGVVLPIPMMPGASCSRPAPTSAALLLTSIVKTPTATQS